MYHLFQRFQIFSFALCRYPRSRTGKDIGNHLYKLATSAQCDLHLSPEYTPYIETVQQLHRITNRDLRALFPNDDAKMLRKRLTNGHLNMW